MKIGIVLGIFRITAGFTSCNSDDNLEIIYDFTTAIYTDDATRMQNLFLDKKWFMTKTISGDTVEETDAKAKTLFHEIVEKANQELAKMKLNGNCKFTYRCTRENNISDNKIEIAKQEWKYLKNK